MRRRLLGSYLLITTGVLVILLVPLAVTYRGRLRDDRRAALQTQAFLVGAFAEDHLEDGEHIDVAGLRKMVARVPLGAGDRVVVTDLEGHTLVDDGSGTLPADVRALVRSARTGRERAEVADGRSVVAVPVASNGRILGAVVLSSPLSSVERRTHQYWLELAAVAAGALLLVGVTGIALARSVARPLDALRLAADELGSGDLTVRAAADDGPPEVQAVAADFNRMAGRIEDLVRAEVDFVGDASHELRTPLTALRLQLENLASEPGGPGPSDLEEPLAEVERLSRLVEGLLALARADAGAVTRPAPIDVVAGAAARVDAWQPLAAELGTTLELAPAPRGGVRAAADGDRLAQVLDNLIANALDATPPGGSVVVRAAAGPGGPTLHVVDDGPGLSPADRLRAFDRFWRGPARPGDEDQPSTGLGGNGLGLAITARLVAVDGGTIRLDEAPSGGIDAVVTLRPA